MVGFIGLGKLGLDCAEVMARQYEVRGYDIHARVSTDVNICGIAELVVHSNWIFIAVPTPHAEGYDGSVPSSHMEPRDFGHNAVIDAINNINQYATTRKKVVLISTVLPGTTRRKFITLLDPRHQFCYNPYLIAMGSTKWDMVNPEMVIIGTEDGSLTGIAGDLIALYKPIMQNDTRHEVGTWDECEAIKIFYNTWISTKVGLVNMIQDFAVRIGNINVDVVTNALARSSMRITGPKYMTAGMGDAGACVLPSFKVIVDGIAVSMEDLYVDYCNDPERTRLVNSVNYSCCTQEQKKIDIVTCREYSGELIKFTTDAGDELITTPEHLIPVSRNGSRLIIRADQIVETDKLYKVELLVKPPLGANYED